MLADWGAARLSGHPLREPENAAEANRLRCAPPVALLITARAPHGESAAFITALPGRG